MLVSCGHNFSPIPAYTLSLFLFLLYSLEKMAVLDKMLNVSVWGWPKGRSPNSCVLVPVSRHLVHSTRNAGTRGGERCPSPPLKSSVHPSIPSHCPQGSRQPQLNTDLPERAQVQQGVCPTAKCCASVSFRLMRELCSPLFHFWGD